MAHIYPNDILSFALQNLNARRLEVARMWFQLLRETGSPQVADVYIRQIDEALSLARRVDAQIELQKPFYKVSLGCQIRNLGEIYEQNFGRIRSGCFVEVGAFDGRTVSNTDSLADLGWSGLYIEPVPEYFEKCREHHQGNQGITVVNCAVGLREEDLEMFVHGVFTTGSRQQRADYDEIEWAKRSDPELQTVTVRKMRLETLLRLFRVPRGFELLIVDVEGMEDEVIGSFDLSWWAPRMAIIELEDEHPDFLGNEPVIQRCRTIREKFREAGYREVHKDIINTIFVKEGGDGREGGGKSQ